MNIDEQQNTIPKIKVDNIKKSLRDYIINYKMFFDVSIGLILCVAYSAIYGGLATIVGSAVTIFLKGYVDE
jgi:hypothetical protein